MISKERKENSKNKIRIDLLFQHVEIVLKCQTHWTNRVLYFYSFLVLRAYQLYTHTHTRRRSYYVDCIRPVQPKTCPVSLPFFSCCCCCFHQPASSTPEQVSLALRDALKNFYFSLVSFQIKNFFLIPLSRSL